VVVQPLLGYEKILRSTRDQEGKAINAQITIPLDIPDVRVLQLEITPRGGCTITIASTLEGTRCRKCGREIREFHGLDEWLTLRHLPILGRKVFLRLRPKRYRCPYCEGGPTTTQELSWYAARSPHTKAYEKYLLLQLVHATVEDVSLKEELGYKALEGIVDRWISREVQWAEVQGREILGLDEIALKKGHRDFVVIVTARSAKGEVKVLAVLPDRKKETVKEFLERIPTRLKRAFHTVCTDLYEGFINAVKEVLGQVEVVADRYHVAKLYRECAERLRKQELQRLKKDLAKEHYEGIKGAMWPFRKNPADLEADEQALLQRLFAHAPDLQRAYTYREQLTAIFEQDLSKAEAKQEIKKWRRRVTASGLKCYESFFTTLDNWLEEITNYFSQRRNSGFVEGLNNKIKVLKRRCYGIFNLAHLFQRLFLDLEGYRMFAPRAG
jgi:transposase